MWLDCRYFCLFLRSGQDSLLFQISPIQTRMNGGTRTCRGSMTKCHLMACGLYVVHLYYSLFDGSLFVFSQALILLFNIYTLLLSVSSARIWMSHLISLMDHWMVVQRMNWKILHTHQVSVCSLLCGHLHYSCYVSSNNKTWYCLV